MTSYRRRGFLAGVGSASALTLAGCLGDDDDGGMESGMDDESGMNGDGMDDESGMNGDGMEDGGSVGNTLSTHPASADADEWPVLGPEIGEADATLVVFDDVSCPRCAAYHENAISTIRSEHVETGEVSLVVRPYPVVYEWGGPAAHALEATYDRDAEAFWDLQSHYFETQGEFDADNVLDRTESWLDGNTDLDAAAVVEDAADERFGDRIAATLAAGDETDAGGVTPVTFAFTGDELVTTLTGSVSFVTLETVLGL